ncbi:MAG: hypothetical protein NT025_07640 [bacterium]|nr:hypothetical protein [bacterium]
MNPRLLIVSSLTLAAFCAWVRPAAAANTLLDVRVGPHKRFDRIVFEFENEASSRVVLKNNQKVEVRFTDVRLLDHFSVPALPRGLTVLRGIDAYREGESGLVFEILLARDATPTELPLAGRPWRLALDLAPRVSENPDEKPEYVPGDQPIPTKFAEAPLSVGDTVNTAQLRAVLAYFYLAQGDTRRALEQAALYQKIAGTPLDLGFNRSAPQTAPTPLPPAWQPAWNRWRLSPAVLLMAALGIGFALGIIIRGFAPRVRISLQRTPRFPRRRKEKTPRDLAEEIANDLDVLDDVVLQEPPRAPAEPVTSPEAAEAAVESDAEKELRDTVRDRRVARVLELSREGRSISAIAEELQMGQDEIKLILDLKGQ